MCHGDGDVSLRFSRFEPVRHEAEAIACGSLPLDTLARLFRSVHRPQVANRRQLCLQNWTPYRRILRHCYSRANFYVVTKNAAGDPVRGQRQVKDGHLFGGQRPSAQIPSFPSAQMTSGPIMTTPMA